MFEFNNEIYCATYIQFEMDRARDALRRTRAHPWNSHQFQYSLYEKECMRLASCMMFLRLVAFKMVGHIFYKNNATLCPWLSTVTTPSHFILTLNEKLLAHFLIFIYSNNSMSPAHLFVLSRCLCLTFFSIVLNINLIFCIPIVWESHACETMNEPLKRAFDEWETERNTKKRTKTEFYLHQTGFETEYTIDIAHRARDWSTSTHTQRKLKTEKTWIL